MAFRNDNSCDYTRWSNRKLLAKLDNYANFTQFGSYFRNVPVAFGCQAESGDFIREETDLYRRTWVQPLIDELRRRLVKP